MKILYGIGKRTSPNISRINHIDNNGKPLCQDNRKVFSWVKDEGIPNCKKCIKKFDAEA